MKSLEEVFELKLLDYFPKIENCSLDKIMAIFANSTYKKKLTVDLDENRIEKIHQEATRRGHGTITSLPDLLLFYRGTRVLDYYLTSFKFTRALITSTRRIDYEIDDFALPQKIIDSNFKDEVESIIKEAYNFYKKMLQEGIEKDHARKILPLCYFSQGVVKMPLDLAIKLAYFTEEKLSEFMFIKRSLDQILETVAPKIYENKKKLNLSTTYSSSNIFQEDNLVSYEDSTKVLGYFILPEALDFLEEYKLENNVDYSFLAEKLHSKIYVHFSKFISLAVYNEEKRHTTVHFAVESIYDAINYALYRLNSIENLVYVPSILEKKGLVNEYLEINRKLLELYKKLVQHVLKEDAVYIIPQSLKIHVNGTLDSYNLFHPFGYLSIRSCKTSDIEMYETTNELIKEIISKLPQLKPYLGQKCKIGFCPEKNYCHHVIKYNPNYNQEIHKRYLL